MTGTFKAPRSWRWAKTFQGVADSKWYRERLVRRGKVVLVVPFGGETQVGPKTVQAASAPCICTQAGARAMYCPQSHHPGPGLVPGPQEKQHARLMLISFNVCLEQ